MTRLEEIEELAESIAESYFPHDRIEPYQIAEHKGITHNFGHYQDAFDGLLEYKNHSFHIYTNADRLNSESHPRARFTMGHELGHFFIDDHRNALTNGMSSHGSFSEFQTDNKAEREADIFAAGLLMPKKRFYAEAKKLRPSINSIKTLSDKFGASYSSIAIRYAKSNAASIIVMRWSSEGRHWCWSSNDLWYVTKNSSYRKFENIPEGSLTSHYFKGLLTAHDETRGATLNAWFPGVLKGSHNNFIMHEEILPIGNFGVITILYPDRFSISIR